jgi:hypothetical protein
MGWIGGQKSLTLDLGLHKILTKHNDNQKTILRWWVDASYGGSLFASLWTLCKVYSIQMPQMHWKIINLTKKFMD